MADTDGLIRVRHSNSGEVGTLTRVQLKSAPFMDLFVDPQHIYIVFAIDPEGIEEKMASGELTADEVVSWRRHVYADINEFFADGWTLQEAAA